MKLGRLDLHWKKDRLLIDCLRKMQGASKDDPVDSTMLFSGLSLSDSGRLARAIAHRLRCDGVLVCASVKNPKGYWIAQTRQEAEDWLKMNGKRLKSQLRAHNGFKRGYIRKYNRQPSML